MELSDVFFYEREQKLTFEEGAEILGTPESVAWVSRCLQCWQPGRQKNILLVLPLLFAAVNAARLPPSLVSLSSPKPLFTAF